MSPRTPSSLGFTNSILLDAVGGLVGVARFLCCFPFVGPVDRGDESDVGEAIALDRRKARIDRRRHCDNRNLPRRNAGERANSAGAVVSIFHLRASPIFTSTSSRAQDSESGSYERKPWVRAGQRIIDRARLDDGEQGHPIHAQRRLRGRPGSRGALLFQSSDSHAAIFAGLPSRTSFL